MIARLTPSEHDEQVLFFQWAEYVRFGGKELRPRCYAVPNGGHRHRAVAGWLKAEGVTAGRPDVNVDIVSGAFAGLRIETKRRGGKKPTAEQQKTLEMLKADGYQAVVCYGFDEMRAAVVAYLSLSHRVVDRWRG